MFKSNHVVLKNTDPLLREFTLLRTFLGLPMTTVRVCISVRDVLPGV